MTTSNVSPDDVRRYIDTDLSDSEIQPYIEEADKVALRYNDTRDFYDDELDDLVKFYTVYLLLNPSETTGEVKQLQQNSRSVTLTTSSTGRGWIIQRVMANDPSGNVLGGRRSERNISFSGGES